MAPQTIRGTFTALVTPLQAGGTTLDTTALTQLVADQLQGGVCGLVPCGTTGETPTLSAAEQLQVISVVAEAAAGKVPIFAGTGSNDTARSISHSKAALKAGASGVMIVMPYYNKPSQRGMREHVLAIARALPCPIILYNIPGRSVVDLAADTTEEICEQAANVVALKDATGNVMRCQELKRRLGERLTVMSGDDALTVPMMAAGASGVISVSANVLPGRVAAVTTAMEAGDLAAARSAHMQLLPLHGAMFLEPNPGPCKAALAMRGKMLSDMRLPLVPISEATRSHLEGVLTALGEGATAS